VTGKLAREAASLNASGKIRSELPALVLMTDDDRLANPAAAAQMLPRGSLVVVRARDAARRAALAQALLSIGIKHGIRVSIAGDPELAARCNADGVHFPEARIGEAAHWRVRHPRWLVTCAAHSLNACARASLARADAVLLAPVFATQSHPGRACLGPFRARAIAHASTIPVYALGGITAQNAGRLAGGGFIGLAAVDGLAHGAPVNLFRPQQKGRTRVSGPSRCAAGLGQV
jgi:thiamine-phosphate pyrophosphorylase